MKIKEIHLEKFKRFTDLTIKNIPSTAKLVVLVGPNGCGKSSLFDAFRAWHMMKGYFFAADKDYCRKDSAESRAAYELVNIQFHNEVPDNLQDFYKNKFYFRTAYRNSPEIKVQHLQQVTSPVEKINNKMMIANDETVDDNYQRLLSKTLGKVYDESYNEVPVKNLRDELISKIREPLQRLFPDLLFTEVGMITDKADFYFDKGTVKHYGYEKLSGGEKAVFDLLLDLVIKSEYYNDTVFCIDEPETHIHTKLQAALLKELFNLINDESQLWIATHSFGMLKQAKKLAEEHPNEVVFINFDGYDFDETVVLEPTDCDAAIWNKMIEISFDDYAAYISPETIVFCEGSARGHTRQNFDARCYTNIFKNIVPKPLFISSGSCSEIENVKKLKGIASILSPESEIIILIDRDDRSEEEIRDLEAEGITVLSKRNLESYLLDDEVLAK